ncbi:MAG TPA: hypothetical protein VHU92_11360 [Streptosporangiaceae bacterium]|nr:hypothetical protein [Streptosporangiaceae bacterium]
MKAGLPAGTKPGDQPRKRPGDILHADDDGIVLLPSATEEE